MKYNVHSKLLDISNNKAKTVLYTLAKKSNGKLRVEVCQTWLGYQIWLNCQRAIVAYVNGRQINSGTPISTNNEICIWCSEDELEYCRKNKYKMILSQIINCTAKGKDIYLGSLPNDVFVKKWTTLEQLLIETDLIA